MAHDIDEKVWSLLDPDLDSVVILVDDAIVGLAVAYDIVLAAFAVNGAFIEDADQLWKSVV